VSIFTQVSFAFPATRLGNADFVEGPDGFRWCENKEPYVSSAFHGAQDARHEPGWPGCWFREVRGN
jgi:hypothetical protein